MPDISRDQAKSLFRAFQQGAVTSDPMAEALKAVQLQQAQLNLQQDQAKEQAAAERAKNPPPIADPLADAESRQAVGVGDSLIQSINELASVLGSESAQQFDLGLNQGVENMLRRSKLFGFGPEVGINQDSSLGKFLGLQQTNEEIQFRSGLENLGAQYRLFLSGQQVSDKEAERLERNLVPTNTDSPRQIANKLSALAADIQSRKSNIQIQGGQNPTGLPGKRTYSANDIFQSLFPNQFGNQSVDDYVKSLGY